MSTEVSVNDGKYTVVLGDVGELSALRYGEPWRDLTGDNLIYFLALELDEARDIIRHYEDLLDAFQEAQEN